MGTSAKARGLRETSPVALASSADYGLGAIGAPRIEIAQDLFELLVGDHRAHLDARLGARRDLN
jgi:hypothetical protein